jgi:hypothetical protein
MRRPSAVGIGVGALFVLLVGVFAGVRLSREPRYPDADPAAIARNEAAAVRRVADLARSGGPEGASEADGYRFRLAGARAYAWPARQGVTGLRTYVADPSGRVAWTHDPRYSGPDGPAHGADLPEGAPEAARVRTGADGNVWRLLHD